MTEFLNKTLKFSLIGLLLAVGCSSAGLNPVNTGDPSDFAFSSKPLSIIASSPDGSSGEGIFGLFEGYIDFENANAELISLRHTSYSGMPESAETDITSFLMGIPCADCAKIVGLRLDSENRAVLRIGVRHPFLPGNPMNPPTAMNRLDLHVFNVRGFIVSDGNTSTINFPDSGFKVGGFKLINADGLSGEFDTYWDNLKPTEANLHPYILHFDDYGAGNFDPTSERGFTTITAPEGNLVMPMGSEMDIKEYIFDLQSSQPFRFIFTLSASYGISAANKNQRLEPTYRIPQFNSKAASEVRVTSIDNSGLISGDASSSCKITIEVFDINHGVGVGEEINQMTSDSSVAEFIVEIPGVTDPVWETTSPNLFFKSGDGRNTPLIYDLVITNEAAGTEGIYNGLIGVVDSFYFDPVLPGNAIHYVEPGGDPTEAFFNVERWVTYTTFHIEVLQGCGPISGSITTPSTSAITIKNNETVQFSGSGTSANGGDPIVEYEWNWNDGSSKSYGNSVEHQFTNPNCDNGMDPVVYNVTLTLTDSCVPANKRQVGSVNVTVECPDCLNPFEDFDGGTVGDWSVEEWYVANTDTSGLFYGGWDEFQFHQGSINCNMSMCHFQNCFFTSGDNIAEGLDPGFCNDYSGPGRYYLISPVIDLSSISAPQASISIWHFFHVLSGSVPDGCAVYVSTNGGLSFPAQLDVISGVEYNSTFTDGIRNGDSCFSGITPGEYVAQSVFDLTPFIGESEVVIRFEQHNNNSGAVGTPGYPVGWWIDDITLNICP